MTKQVEGVFSPSICCSYKEGTITHTYDNQSHLLKAAGDTTYTYTYDDAGNILTANGHTYTYGDANWKDLLTAFDGNSISYDAIGNPTSYYNGTRWTMTWTGGRNLTTAVAGGNSLSFAYNANGLRTSKTVNGVNYQYYYAGGKLMRMTWGSNTIDFFYDTSGLPYAMKYNGAVYYYVTNLQGDVMRIVNASGAVVASYDYDPYGKVISATGTLANVNPLRYRGYVYDQETGFYYLQSRYYDPVLSRFVNADSYVSTGDGIIGHNMFAYCNNSPVNALDPTGHAFLLLTAAIGAIAGAVIGGMRAAAKGGKCSSWHRDWRCSWRTRWGGPGCSSRGPAGWFCVGNNRISSCRRECLGSDGYEWWVYRRCVNDCG